MICAICEPQPADRLTGFATENVTEPCEHERAELAAFLEHTQQRVRDDWASVTCPLRDCSQPHPHWSFGL